MPTARRPKRRDAAIRVTPEAVDAFIRASELRRVYFACAAGACRSPTKHGRCAECDEYLQTAFRLHHVLLGLPPWHENPLDCDAEGPMPSWMKGKMIGETYSDAQAIRRALIAEAQKVWRKRWQTS